MRRLFVAILPIPAGNISRFTDRGVCRFLSVQNRQGADSDSLGIKFQSDLRPFVGVAGEARTTGYGGAIESCHCRI